MEQSLDYEIHSKETLYFIIKVISSIVGYALIFLGIIAVIDSPNPAVLLPLFFYLILFLLFLFFQLGILIGHIKGNAVKVSTKQFPEIYKIVQKQCVLLELKTVPNVFILQSGGVLNAFATRFLGANYVVIYSEILEEAFENNIETVEFIIGHELGHIKRKHMTKSLILFPSVIIPFLNLAYSRACEFTCDNIGAALNPKGIQTGLVLLASGKKLWRKVNVERLIEQESTEAGFWMWFAEKISSHPRLTKRISRFYGIATKSSVPSPLQFNETIAVKEVKTDHSSFMPK